MNNRSQIAFRFIFQTSAIVLLLGVGVIFYRVEQHMIRTILPLLMLLSGAYVAGKLLEAGYKLIARSAYRMFPDREQEPVKEVAHG